MFASSPSASPPQPSYCSQLPPDAGASANTLRHKRRKRQARRRKEGGRAGGGGAGDTGGLRLGLCRIQLFFHQFLGPLFSLSAASVFGRRPEGRETMARCADPRVQRRLAGRRDVGVAAAAAALVLHRKGALQWFQPAVEELPLPSTRMEHIDLTGSVAAPCTVLIPPTTPPSPNPQYKFPSSLRTL